MRGKPNPYVRGAGIICAGLLLASATACARIRTVDTKDAAFIYGFFDVPQKVGAANCVGIIQDEKVGIAGRHGCMMTSPEGLFYVENVPSMRYNIHSFYVDNEFHSLGSMAKPFLVKPGSMHYVGTFKYHRVSDPGMLTKGKYTLTPTSHPTHAEILKKLLVQDDIDPRWKKRISARLRELGAVAN